MEDRDARRTERGDAAPVERQPVERGEDTDTEALRQALRRYHSFFDCLLAL